MKVFKVLSSFTGTQPPSFFHVLCVAAFMIQRQSRTAAAETVWPVKLKLLMVWPFTKRVCQPLPQTIGVKLAAHGIARGFS